MSTNPKFALSKVINKLCKYLNKIDKSGMSNSRVRERARSSDHLFNKGGALLDIGYA